MGVPAPCLHSAIRISYDPQNSTHACTVTHSQPTTLHPPPPPPSAPDNILLYQIAQFCFHNLCITHAWFCAPIHQVSGEVFCCCLHPAGHCQLLAVTLCKPLVWLGHRFIVYSPHQLCWIVYGRGIFHARRPTMGWDSLAPFERFVSLLVGSNEFSFCERWPLNLTHLNQG